MITKQYYSHGKLLLTGEYLVLDGAQALAVPTKKGQFLTVTPRDSKAFKEGVIHWKSYEVTGDCWFSCCLEFTSSGLQQFKSEEASAQKIAITLLNILNTARQLNPDFLKERQVYAVTTQLEFDRHWGLGTSSTLINNIAQWAFRVSQSKTRQQSVYCTLPGSGTSAVDPGQGAGQRHYLAAAQCYLLGGV